MKAFSSSWKCCVYGSYLRKSSVTQNKGVFFFPSLSPIDLLQHLTLLPGACVCVCVCLCLRIWADVMETQPTGGAAHVERCQSERRQRGFARHDCRLYTHTGRVRLHVCLFFSGSLWLERQRAAAAGTTLPPTPPPPRCPDGPTYGPLLEVGSSDGLPEHQNDSLWNLTVH